MTLRMLHTCSHQMGLVTIRFSLFAFIAAQIRLTNPLGITSFYHTVGSKSHMRTVLRLEM